MTQIMIPLAGELGPDGHRLTQRVYYEDTDFSGVVYHARYLHFLERGRTDFLRCLGVEQAEMVVDGEKAAFVVRHMEIDFLASARMDDILTVLTRTETAAGARMVLRQTILKDQTQLMEATVTIALINTAGRPRRLSMDLQQKMLNM
ncbi:tol-pal system-associated acyl-CoA thioesterase [Rhizobium sp. TRM95796]|uniref:tol-pal system-associated acyl-CoA thioesterase n=1 Tax=Rhizobium sp. TRM95796 TaxID=2979862 RepID=UPI0021E72B3C|nr:tol-pal system-associated acyl-CoA thioesterase [Rhizobium sp. TRM95796]MCV3765813.1 tol-pal system-associated acyl-CoA thioesterase [Rhizobium sp. TRM95796]